MICNQLDIVIHSTAGIIRSVRLTDKDLDNLIEKKYPGPHVIVGEIQDYIISDGFKTKIRRNYGAHAEDILTRVDIFLRSKKAKSLLHKAKPIERKSLSLED